MFDRHCKSSACEEDVQQQHDSSDSSLPALMTWQCQFEKQSLHAHAVDMLTQLRIVDIVMVYSYMS